jgi:glyoxylase-like metal-dependent hydrolase (beta-lactamase superfamily II)
MTHVEPVAVGRCTVRTICEGFAPMPLADELPDSGVSWERERVTFPWAFLGADAWAWHVHAFVVETPAGVVLIDTGTGSFGPYRPWANADPDAWAELDVADVEHVVLTHLHADHAGGMEDERSEPRFPNAAYHLHPSDLRHFESEHPDAYVAVRPAERLEELGVLRTQDANHDVAPGVRVVHAPGHTPGHRAVLIQDGGQALLLTGDLLHLPTHAANPMWPSSHDEDALLGVASRRLLLWRAQTHAWRVAVSHFARPFGAVTDAGWVASRP